MTIKNVPRNPSTSNVFGKIMGKPGFGKTGHNKISNVIALGRKYLFDEPHGLQVAGLSVLLFDQTGKLHGLGKKERLILLAAGILHDIGMFVSCRDHQKHSMRVIKQNEISGFSPRQIKVVAQVARYHRKEGPSSKSGSFSGLPGKDKATVKILSAYLRIGDVLDRDHRQKVVSIDADFDRNNLNLRIKGDNGLFLDSMAFKKKAGFFEKLFGIDIRTFQEPVK